MNGLFHVGVWAVCYFSANFVFGRRIFSLWMDFHEGQISNSYNGMKKYAWFITENLF